jgi:NADH-quinone oxidoreductase subunit G
MSANPKDIKMPPASDTVTIEVDGRRLQARKGQMLIEVTDASGITIPRFCYHNKLSIAANCRMCLVDVEKAPKPLPACATPVAEGMVVHTRSDRARTAQKSTMEFLLINHPLDCPVCDQGGECELQDLAVGYGKDVSRYAEAKRIVKDRDIGPLISTDMTRCIHCTRCVRFGQEIAGVMEFGGLGRGEHMEIRTFLDRSVDSELSGNVIDLCPVGALTSKPFRYTARPWELEDHASISPHDCVGANINVQVRRGSVMRVLPRDNEAVNECWLADRDRFSYESLKGEDRLRVPMIRRGTKWEETDWTTAFEFTVAGLKRVLAHGPESLGALASPISTLEEFYLLQKLMRALGSGSVDHRLRQMDFSDDGAAPLFPSLGRPIAELESLDSALLIGANPRKDQPLINLRLRKSALKGARVFAINSVDYDFSYRLAGKVIAGPAQMVRALAGVARALSALKKAEWPAAFAKHFRDVKPGVSEQAMAEALQQSKRASVLLGSFALSHPQAAALRALAQYVADLCGAKLGQLPDANGAGAWLAGCVPHRGAAGKTAMTGRTARDMLLAPRKSYLLLGLEPELDCLDGAAAGAAMRAAEFVVMLTTFKPSPYRTRAVEYADVWLPLAPFTETDGTFVNAEGRRQEFVTAVSPLAEARPGWKILRMLGHHLGLSGFEQAGVDDVRREMNLPDTTPAASSFPYTVTGAEETLLAAGQLMRLAEVPIYAMDAIVRRASALQKTVDNPPPAARMNAAQADKLGLAPGDNLQLVTPQGVVRLELVVDARVPDGCVLAPAGYPETVMLGAHGPVTVRVAS